MPRRGANGGQEWNWGFRENCERVTPKAFHSMDHAAGVSAKIARRGCRFCSSLNVEDTKR